MTLTFQEAQAVAASWPGMVIGYARDYCPFQVSKKRYILEFANDEGGGSNEEKEDGEESREQSRDTRYPIVPLLWG